MPQITQYGNAKMPQKSTESASIATILKTKQSESCEKTANKPLL